MSRSRISLFVIFSLVIVLGVFASTPAMLRAQDTQPIEITVLSNFTSDIARGEVLNAIIDEFNQAHEGEITVISNPDPDWPTLQQRIKSLIAAGSPPDVFLYNYNANDLSREESGQLMDWTPYLEADPDWMARFRPEHLQALTVNGEIVGLPSDTAPVLFYYHTDLFEQAGIESFPTTWDEFMTAAEALKAIGVAPIALMTADDAWHSMNAFTYLAAGLGGPDVFAIGEPLNSEGVISAAGYLNQLFEYSTADAVGANYSVSVSNFLNKNAAMIIDGPWLISSIQSQYDDPCTVGVAVSPTFGDDTIPAGFIVTDSLNPWGAAKQSDSAKELAVVEWMKFMTSPENVARLSIEGAYPMAINTTFSEEQLAEANCQMREVLQLANAAPAAVVEAVRNIPPAAQAQVPSLLEGLALGQLSPEEFANELQTYSQ